MTAPFLETVADASWMVAGWAIIAQTLLCILLSVQVALTKRWSGEYSRWIVWRFTNLGLFVSPCRWTGWAEGMVGRDGWLRAFIVLRATILVATALVLVMAALGAY